MAPRSVPVVLELERFAPTEGAATLLDRAPAARIGRAIVALVAAWAAAFVAIFIPILHFVLVPGLLITGIVLFVLRLREDCTLQMVRGRCPRCCVERVYVLGGRCYDGRAFHCDGCGEQPRVRLPASSNQPAAR